MYHYYLSTLNVLSWLAYIDWDFLIYIPLLFITFYLYLDWQVLFGLGFPYFCVPLLFINFKYFIFTGISIFLCIITIYQLKVFHLDWQVYIDWDFHIYIIILFITFNCIWTGDFSQRYCFSSSCTLSNKDGRMLFYLDQIPQLYWTCLERKPLPPFKLNRII